MCNSELSSCSMHVFASGASCFIYIHVGHFSDFGCCGKYSASRHCLAESSPFPSGVGGSLVRAEHLGLTSQQTSEAGLLGATCRDCAVASNDKRHSTKFLIVCGFAFFYSVSCVSSLVELSQVGCQACFQCGLYRVCE